MCSWWLLSKWLNGKQSKRLHRALQRWSWHCKWNNSWISAKLVSFPLASLKTRYFGLRCKWASLEPFPKRCSKLCWMQASFKSIYALLRWPSATACALAFRIWMWLSGVFVVIFVYGSFGAAVRDVRIPQSTGIGGYVSIATRRWMIMYMSGGWDIAYCRRGRCISRLTDYYSLGARIVVVRRVAPLRKVPGSRVLTIYRMLVSVFMALDHAAAGAQQGKRAQLNVARRRFVNGTRAIRYR